MDIVIANGFAMERCTFFSYEYHSCVLHNTRCKCEDYNPRNSKPITHADHGRPIDAVMLRQKCYQHYEDFMNGKIDGKTALLNIEKEIINAPTVIPVAAEDET